MATYEWAQPMGHRDLPNVTKKNVHHLMSLSGGMGQKITQITLLNRRIKYDENERQEKD